MSNLQLKIDGEAITCELLNDRAPNTCRAIEELMPFRGELHYAKIAGEEIYFGIPLLLPLEQSSAVHGLPAGSVAYWPDRQVFCVYYGAPQEEAATVTIFARVTQNLLGLRRLGEEVRLQQGKPVLVEMEAS